MLRISRVFRKPGKMKQRGVSPEQWDHLRNKQRLGYFNITAAIASAGLSLLGWLVDWAAGGIQQDRHFLLKYALYSFTVFNLRSLCCFYWRIETFTASESNKRKLYKYAG